MSKHTPTLFKKGQQVQIFHDPITQLKPEGTATLVKFCHGDDEGFPKEKIVTSSFYKLDPKVQLREAGHPFNYIGSELTQLQGRFELVNSGVEALRESLNSKIDETKDSLLSTVDTLFQTKFLWAASLCLGAISGMYAVIGFLRQQFAFNQNEVYLVAGALGVILPFLGWYLFLRKKKA